MFTIFKYSQFQGCCNLNTYTSNLFQHNTTNKVALTNQNVTCQYKIFETGSNLVLFAAAEYYLTVGGATTEYCKAHLKDQLGSLGLKCDVEDRSEDMVILSLQGPSR